ncbi:Acyl-coenzyme A:6-aminopenicillanic-acid-acyltransferase 40 kDa form, putative [Cordyceps militaris CM01]|uniref:Acyl-coenzyme A:6-aminopenicillanic-acid-acyltransferase 40 kDa form, putative n=1 Tax=Cordyceps militaris (strain CM01) TaxID=983644 RepID=G3JJW7_CORMM|nr:Acyl-coenzyme A:6-aminopenicillanic-acid-acyltransferase 40 kDa form, putative [Cordyceps militaris CM01]EGX91304.1 Acyl-coenzyme A:6-aminopenicillanic-acid-acyltransferase 40 kDa form, putative [Cordyceps militaris CM01]
MLEITCSGTPYEIGFRHGSQAKTLVHGSVEFYIQYFRKNSQMSWAAAEDAASKFHPFLERHVPHLVEEMQANGAGLSYAAVLALNARTEISMGMMDDGCTSLAWKTDMFSVAGQNWDWDVPQKARLVLLHIKPAPDGSTQRPRASLVTEAGLLCKSGINSAGVGVFINAIKARGVRFDALPLHVAFRVVLDSESRVKAVARLRALALGTSGHILVADRTGGTSLEFTHLGVRQLDMADGRLAHTNHFLVAHEPPVADAVIFPDSLARMARISELLARANAKQAGGGVACCERMLQDEEGFPTAINRKRSPVRDSETLFSIVADLEAGMAYVKLGRPSEPDGHWVLKPAELRRQALGFDSPSVDAGGHARRQRRADAVNVSAGNGVAELGGEDVVGQRKGLVGDEAEAAVLVGEDGEGGDGAAVGVDLRVQGALVKDGERVRTQLVADDAPAGAELGDRLGDEPPGEDDEHLGCARVDVQLADGAALRSKRGVRMHRGRNKRTRKLDGRDAGAGADHGGKGLAVRDGLVVVLAQIKDKVLVVGQDAVALDKTVRREFS